MDTRGATPRTPAPRPRVGPAESGEKQPKRAKGAEEIVHPGTGKNDKDEKGAKHAVFGDVMPWAPAAMPVRCKVLCHEKLREGTVLWLADVDGEVSQARSHALPWLPQPDDELELTIDAMRVGPTGGLVIEKFTFAKAKGNVGFAAPKVGLDELETAKVGQYCWFELQKASVELETSKFQKLVMVDKRGVGIYAYVFDGVCKFEENKTYLVRALVRPDEKRTLGVRAAWVTDDAVWDGQMKTLLSDEWAVPAWSPTAPVWPPPEGRSKLLGYCVGYPLQSEGAVNTGFMQDNKVVARVAVLFGPLTAVSRASFGYVSAFGDEALALSGQSAAATSAAPASLPVFRHKWQLLVKTTKNNEGRVDVRVIKAMEVGPRVDSEAVAVLRALRQPAAGAPPA